MTLFILTPLFPTLIMANWSKNEIRSLTIVKLIVAPSKMNPTDFGEPICYAFDILPNYTLNAQGDKPFWMNPIPQQIPWLKVKVSCVELVQIQFIFFVAF